LRDLLVHEPDIEVNAETSNGLEAVTLCSRLRPDVVLIDIRMPQMDGLTAPRETKQKHPITIAIMVTMHETQVSSRSAYGGALPDTFSRMPPSTTLSTL
jgi:DNA-binding NarL/FixJ family response regulator